MRTCELYESLTEFDRKLLATFPNLLTDADIHEMMMQTTRGRDENLQQFCHQMMAIARKGNLPEATMVRYIVKREFSVSVINT